jgi:hypothetical protein
VQRDGRRRFQLGFRSAADNLGAGPLVVDAARDPRRSSLLAMIRIAHDARGRPTAKLLR